jgi:hypothetical protein
LVCRSRGRPRTSPARVPRSPWRSRSTSSRFGLRTRKSPRPTSSSRARRRPIALPERCLRTLARRRATCSTPRPISPARALHGSTLASMLASRVRGSSMLPDRSARGHPMSNHTVVGEVSMFSAETNWIASTYSSLSACPCSRQGATIRRAGIRESSRRWCEPPSSKTTRRPSRGRSPERWSRACRAI